MIQNAQKKQTKRRIVSFSVDDSILPIKNETKNRFIKRISNQVDIKIRNIRQLTCLPSLIHCLNKFFTGYPLYDVKLP